MNISVTFTNPFVLVFFAGTLISFLIKHFLEFIDYRARVKNGGVLPFQLADIPAAKETFDTEKLKKICEYENAKYFAWLPESICILILSLSLVIFGFYPFVFNMICSWTGFPSTFFSTFLCFSLFMIIGSIPADLLSLPFSIYKEFVLEKKFGFSKMTVRLWISDQIKQLIISLVLVAILTCAASFFFMKFTNSWWFILAAAMIILTFVLQIIYPKFIAPLFNKFSPLEEGELKNKIKEILNKTGFENGGLFVMDASKRSGHSNAYFSGFGKTKRIVLFDTLIKSLTPEELAAVLGHELGHFKLKHIIKRLFVMIPLEFIVMFCLYKLAQFVDLYKGFGFNSVNAGNVSQVQFIGLFLAMNLYQSVSELLSPVVNCSSRRQEYQADAFSAKVCETPEPLITGLIKLNSDNLSELIPPKLYVFWNYSHPTLIERIEHLKAKE